jgi:radical SAM superfamily enzyme YgiQ (UPF0313 family)
LISDATPVCSPPAEPIEAAAVHPRGDAARVLLTSVYGPYGRDDDDGSRAINPMELYHNQVTRVQGPFSLRMFHRSWGLMLIQENILAPCTLLDFPRLDRFVEELTTREYDIVGISAIIPNLEKVRRMCRLIREHQPRATIVVGGHIANLDGLADRIDADHVVRGEGVAWFRAFLGERVDRPIAHPRILSGYGARTMGIKLPSGPGHVAATVIPSVGCPVGCNFCSTSAMFGGKGKSIDFYRTGDELFEVMARLERELGARSFFMMDENFLLHRPRALRLLELLQEHGKPWSLYVFSSANVVRSYTMEQLVGLGVAWVWMGIEGKDSKYGKLKGVDTRALVRELQSNGICVLGSSIIGMEEHTPANIDAAIDFAVAHETDFHQFMLYTPVAGTPLWEETKARGLLTDPESRDAADTHGQLRFNYRHGHIPPGAETDYLLRSFRRDFEVNGPSVVRMARTILEGWRRHRHHADPRVRARIRVEARGLATGFAGATWAARKWFRRNAALAARLDALLHDIYRECGVRARLAAPLIGSYLHGRLRREAERLAAGWSYEPPTFWVRARQPGALGRLRSIVVAKAGWLPPLPDLGAFEDSGRVASEPSS